MRARGVLDELSAGQWGLLTTAQAEARGVSRLQVARLAGRGQLRRVGQGVYQDAGAPESQFMHVQAAWLASDPSRTAEQRLADPLPDVVVGGATAAFLHGAGDLQPEPVELFVSSPRRTRRAGIRYRNRQVSDAQITVVAGLPVTTVARTISDLVADHTDLSLVAHVFRDAVTDRLVDIDAVAAVLNPETFANLMQVGGIRQAGTERAARVLATALTDALGPEYLTDLANGLQQVVATALAAEFSRTVDLAAITQHGARVGQLTVPAVQVEALREHLRVAVAPVVEAARAAALASGSSSLTPTLRNIAGGQRDADLQRIVLAKDQPGRRLEAGVDR